MRPLLSALDRLPYWLIIWAAVMLAAIPLGEPHLFEKLRMLRAGTLVRPLDWFDLLMHGFPIIVFLLKLAADLTRSRLRTGA
jgi:hypothetical protein